MSFILIPIFVTPYGDRPKVYVLLVPQRNLLGKLKSPPIVHFSQKCQQHQHLSFVLFALMTSTQAIDLL